MLRETAARWLRTAFVPGALCICVQAVNPAAANAATRRVPGQYTTIQSGIDACANGDTVLLAPGVYKGPGNRAIEMRGKTLVLTSSDGPEATVIDCEWAARGFYLHEGEPPETRIERITIQQGNAASTDPGAGAGGAIYCGASNVTISDCIITKNHAYSHGGGIFLISDGRVENCIINANTGDWGGGIAFAYGTASTINCVITGNLAASGGGVGYPGGDTNGLTRCTIAGNWAWHGGGVSTGNRVQITDCIIWGNCGQSGEEQMSLRNPGAELIACLIDTMGVSLRTASYDKDCVFTNPAFCGAVGCGQTDLGNWTLDDTSPCLPIRSPSGRLIGALGVGCIGGNPIGGCCDASLTCTIETRDACAARQGRYLGDAVSCAPGACTPIPVRSTSWGRIKAAFR